MKTKMKKRLTYERLRELLNYDPLTGIFTWKERFNKDGKRNKCSGKVAGSLDSNGYISIRIDRKLYFGHRLAWLYTQGYIPEHQIDHKNRIKNFNGIKNLREASQACNMQNCKINKNNTSGIKGVYWSRKAKKWQAYITRNKKYIHLGYFNNRLDAAKARYAAEQKYFDCTVASSAQEYINQKVTVIGGKQNENNQ